MNTISRLRLSLLFFSLAAGLSNRLFADETLAELIRRGDQAHGAFNNRAAMDAYQRAWRRDGQNPDILGKLTRSCINVGEDLDSAAAKPYFEKAAAYADELQRLAPDNPQSWFLSAVANGNLAQHRGGAHKLRLSRKVAAGGRRTIALDPTYAPGYVVMGVYYREVAGVNRALRLLANSLLGGMPSGTIEESEKMLLKGVELDPDNLFAHFELARTYEAMGKPRKAVAAYQRVLALPVDDHQAPSFRKSARQRIEELR